MIVPGARVGVLIDPANETHVDLDWQRLNAVGGADPAAGTMTVAFDASGKPISGLDTVVSAVRGGSMATIKGSAAQLLATGTHGTAVITTAQPLGKTVGDYDPTADPSKLKDPMWLFTVEVQLAGQPPFPAMFGHRVPQSKVSLVAPGVMLAVAVDEADKNEEVAIDWDKSPIGAGS